MGEEMRILQKHKDTVEILCKPDEIDFNIGDYLVAWGGDKALLMQVIDVAYADIPGVTEDILRDLSTEEVNGRTLFDPYNVSSLSMLMREIRTVTAKIRGILNNGYITTNSTWLPNRFSAKITKANGELMKITQNGYSSNIITLGTVDNELFGITVNALDGRLTIITGKKESGKSHMAKILVEGLVMYGATVMVLDVNGEYTNLGYKTDGKESHLLEKMIILEPGENFTTTISEIGLGCMLDILEHVYNTPSTSCREFSRVWKMIEKREGKVTFETLVNTMSHIHMNESVREALISRMNTIEATGFINEKKEPTDLKNLLQSSEDGKLVVVNLLNLIPATRKLVVEYLLTKLSSLLKNNLINPLFLFAEEAHLYLRETYWEDIVTRMRHLGLFPVFITNQPDTIPEAVYRQADNIFLFNFSNENDLERISKASRIDSESVKMLGKTLPPRHCLLIGRMVSDIPVMLKVRGSELKTMGYTKSFFRNDTQRGEETHQRNPAVIQ